MTVASASHETNFSRFESVKYSGEQMFKTKQIFSLMRAAVFSIGCAAITFGSQTNLQQTTAQKMSAHMSHAYKGPSYRTHHHRHHHHHRTWSAKGKRVPKAKSLKNESY